MAFKEQTHYFCIDSLYDLYDRKISRNFLHETLRCNINTKCTFVVPTLEFKPTWAFFDIAVGYFRVVASAKFPAVIWGRIGAISLSRFCPVAACFRALRPLVPFTPITMYCNPKSKAKIIEIMQLCFFTSYIHV